MSYLKGVKNTVEFPVVIEIPAMDEDDNEVVVEITPIVKFKRFKRSESRQIQAELAGIAQDAAKAFEEGDVESLFTERLDYFDDLLRNSVKGWRRFPGADDEDVPFTPEVLEEVIESDAYYKGFIRGLRRALGWGDGAPGGSAGVEEKN